jgi:hypothetical protein
MRLARLIIWLDAKLKFLLTKDYEKVRGHYRVLFFLDKEIDDA